MHFPAIQTIQKQRRREFTFAFTKRARDDYAREKREKSQSSSMARDIRHSGKNFAVDIDSAKKDVFTQVFVVFV